MKRALVLCSGGLDSVVTAFLAKKRGYDITLLFFEYKQRGLQNEKKAAEYFAKKLNSELIKIKVPELNLKSRLISGPKSAELKSLKNTNTESQKFYVPQRNLIFLSLAAAIAESLLKSSSEQTHRSKSKKKTEEKITLFVGFKNDGKEFFPDATPQFVKNFNKLVLNSTNGKVLLKAPLIKKDKEDIIILGRKLGIELEKTISCYTPFGKKHCGSCLACRLRKAGFYWANEKDKTIYKNN